MDTQLAVNAHSHRKQPGRRTDEVQQQALRYDHRVEALALEEEGREDPEDEAAKEGPEEHFADPELLRPQLLHMHCWTLQALRCTLQASLQKSRL